MKFAIILSLTVISFCSALEPESSAEIAEPQFRDKRQVLLPGALGMNPMMGYGGYGMGAMPMMPAGGYMGMGMGMGMGYPAVGLGGVLLRKRRDSPSSTVDSTTTPPQMTTPPTTTTMTTPSASTPVSSTNNDTETTTEYLVTMPTEETTERPGHSHDHVEINFGSVVPGAFPGVHILPIEALIHPEDSEDVEAQDHYRTYHSGSARLVSIPTLAVVLAARLL